MRVMVLVKANPASEAGEMPSAELFEAMNRFNQALLDAGVLLAGHGLKPTSQGKRVRMSGTSRTVLDGPFTEPKELVAGFWLWQVRSLDEAVEWARRCPNPHEGGGELEIRPLYEDEDFGDALPAEVRASQDAMRERLAQGGASS